MLGRIYTGMPVRLPSGQLATIVSFSCGEVELRYITRLGDLTVSMQWLRRHGRPV